MTPVSDTHDSQLTAFVVGAGRVGTGLALALPSAGLEVLGTWSRTAAGARRTRRLTGRPASTGRFPKAVAEADLVILTVPDDAVAEVCAALVDAGRVRPGQAVIHCAGSLDLTPLAPAAEVGARVGSLHPLRAFSDPRTAAEAFAGALAVVDGDPELRGRLTRIASALGMRPASLPPGPERRALYHAAAVTAAGHVVALLDLSLELAAAAGLAPEDALKGLVELARGSLENLARAGHPEQALTGPVARGDAGVIDKHLAALDGLPAPTRELYLRLVRRALDVAERGRTGPGHARIRRRVGGG